MITAAVLRARSKIARLKNNLTMLTEKNVFDINVFQSFATSSSAKVSDCLHKLKV